MSAASEVLNSPYMSENPWETADANEFPNKEIWFCRVWHADSTLWLQFAHQNKWQVEWLM